MDSGGFLVAAIATGLLLTATSPGSVFAVAAAVAAIAVLVLTGVRKDSRPEYADEEELSGVLRETTLGLRALGARPPEIVVDDASAVRVILALALCVGYAGGLLGHGLPFWLTSAAFIFIAILSFRWLDRDAETPGLARLAASSAAIAVGAALVISLLFEQVFLVRLP